jgi:predicted membrane channel-forming protein YqfA (hemolysin III family)
MQPPTRIQPFLDLIGAGSALLCAVHCAATGLFVAVLPIVGVSALLNERTELMVLSAAVTLGVVSLGLGWRVHRQSRALLYLALGTFVLFAVRSLFEEGSVAEFATVLLGASLLVTAHGQNHRLSRAHLAAAARLSPSCHGRA